MTKEEIVQAYDLIGKLKAFAKATAEKGAVDTLCGFCLRPIGGSSCGSMEYQNPHCTSYHMDCHNLLRSYEHMFAVDRLLETAPMLAKKFIKSESEKAHKRFTERFLEYIIDNKISLRYSYSSLHAMCDHYGGYDALVKELDDKRKANGWPRLIKEKEGKSE